MGVHVLLLPWPSQSHLTPMLQLAHVLASQQGFIITIVLSSRARARLEAASSPLPLQPNILIQVLHDGLDPQQPSHSPSVEEILASIPIMQQSLETLLQALMASSSPVTYLIDGAFCFWSEPVAHKFSIPCAQLWSSPAYIYCAGFFHGCLLSAGLVPFKGRREDAWITCIPGLAPMKASDFIQELLPSEEEIQADPEMLQRLLHFAKETYRKGRERFRILVNSVYDLESQAFDALSEEHVPVCAIGPLFVHNAFNEADQLFKQPRASMYKEDRTCLQWLDSKASESTLYVAFGCDSKMDKKDMQELAYGLEASGHSFLWVIRPGSVLGDISMEDVLPEGFKERVGERGLVVSWAPQTDVLAHFAIGGFLSHCGWNSTLEALWLGVPILAWPQRVDQPVTKKYIEDEWKVGIAITKNGEGKISRIIIENSVRSLMQGEVGTRIRQAGKQVKELMLKATQDGGSSQRNLDQFIQDLCSLSSVQSSKKT